MNVLCIESYNRILMVLTLSKTFMLHLNHCQTVREKIIKFNPNNNKTFKKVGERCHINQKTTQNQT